jgi:low temperature requirement protein LtrA
VLAALWWAWASYAWLTNTVDATLGPVWAALLAATAAMFVAALAVPEAFGDHGVVFGVAFLVVQAMWLTLYALSSRGDHDLVVGILRVAPSSLAGAVVILLAGFTEGAVRPLLWIAALILAFGVPLITGLSGFHVEPAHFAERHALIVIVAIGEALITTGLGASGTELTGQVITAAVLGLLVATAFWLGYFDFFAIRGRQMLGDRTGPERVAFARDVYTYLHLPLVAGIVLFAFGMEPTLAHPTEEPDTITAFALCGGSALYLLTFTAIRLRVSASVRGGRTTAGVACLLLVPVTTVVPALAALALLAGVWIALHAYELIWWREARRETRALASA